jgi:hypothetical protein
LFSVQSEKELRIPPIDAASYDITFAVCLSVCAPVIVPSKTSIAAKGRRAAIGVRQALMQDTFAAEPNAQVAADELVDAHLTILIAHLLSTESRTSTSK